MHKNCSAIHHTIYTRSYCRRGPQLGMPASGVPDPGGGRIVTPSIYIRNIPPFLVAIPVGKAYYYSSTIHIPNPQGSLYYMHR